MQKTTQLGSDRAYDILRSEHQPLDAIFAPQSIAVIGASEHEGSVGRTVLWNLISHPFGGTVFPVNPKRHSVLGIKAYPNIAAVPEPVDLAIVITPAPTVPSVIGECVDAGVKGAIVISAGFNEAGDRGAELEQQLLQHLRRSKLRLIGPNCLGIRPEDEPLMIQFHQTLSEESVYFRYFHLIKLSQRVAHERLTRICFIDYDREMALIADYRNPQTEQHEILAVGRLSKLHGTNAAEFAMLVSDRFQCRGLGTQLLQQLLQVGRDEHLERICAEILSDNGAMQRVCEKLGFQIYRAQDASVVRAEIVL
ncbi:GNAT family N-acetyltransferase [Scytonema sp. NUACC26]|uniref:GNAT family N-acetyltransferase n=1 Tax=Scytonema sp. NUACC26 TaxID=3140176 RepID=UPI0034DC2DE5